MDHENAPDHQPDHQPAVSDAGPPGAPPRPLRMRARGSADLVAFVPVALGFVPSHSVVVVGVDGAGSMHARVDLPHDVDDVDDAVLALLRAARRNRVRAVVALVYDDDTTVADETAWTLHEELTAAGVRVVDVLRVHDGHWFAVLPGAPLEHYRGVPFELATHPFTARAVLEGRVTHPSREALRATLDPAPDPDGSRARRVRADLATASALAPPDLLALVRRHVAHGTCFSDAELAAVAVSVPDGGLRDQAWVWLERPVAQRAVDLWSDAVRRLPATHVAGPAAVLGFAAWLLGDGALAWCALDRCRAAEPHHSLADLVAQLLESATSPARWEDLRRGLGEVLPGDPPAWPGAGAA